MASSSNRRGAAKTTLPWTTAEEITLCTAWCNAMDTYVTRDIHSRKGFWEEVFANFEKDMGGTIRGYDVIVSKWKNSIRPKVAAFSVVYDGVQRMDENGSSDLVLFQNALAEYQTRSCSDVVVVACVKLSLLLEDNLCAYDCYVNIMWVCPIVNAIAGRLLGVYDLGVATPRAVVHAGDKTSEDASAGWPAAIPRGGGTGGLVGRGGRRVREHRKRNVESTSEPEGQENDQGVEFNEVQIGNQGSNQGNGRNQNGDAINDNVQGKFRNVIENNDRRGCTYKEFLACNPKDNYRTNTPYLKTLKNSRLLPDFEEYAIDTPYMILLSKIKKNTFSANTPYLKNPILCIGQYSVSKKSDMAYCSIRHIQKSDMAYPIPAQEFWNILFLEPMPSHLISRNELLNTPY
ncbi:hypothetical protein Tco_0793354 [Tanacetum coccineum]